MRVVAHGWAWSWMDCSFMAFWFWILLLVRPFLHLSHWRGEEDTSKQITIPHSGKGSIGSNHCKSDFRRVQGGQKSQQGNRGCGHCLGRVGGIESPDFFHLSADLHLQRPVLWLLIGVPFCHHCSRDFYSHVRIDVALTHQQEFVRLCSMTINMILFSFWWHSHLPSTRKEVCNLAYGGQRESNAPWRHYRPLITRLYKTDPRGSEPTNYDGSHKRPRCNNRCAKSSCKNIKIKNPCTTLATPHLG